MVKQVIDTTGTSTSLPSGGNVINSNFTELYNFISTVASGATANATDAQLRDRNTHTGTVDLASDVSGVLPVENFATGTPTGSKFVRDDGVLAAPAGGGDVSAVNNFSEYSGTLTAARAGLGLAIGTDVQAFNSALTGTTATYTTTIDGEVVQLRTDVDTFGLLLAGLARTVRASTFTDTTTDADFNVTILMINTHMVELHPVADAARLGQRITFRLRGANQQTIGPGTASIEGAAVINQNETVVAELIEVGAGTDTVWALTGGGV